MMRRYKLGLVVIDYLQIMGLERGLNYERMLDRITYWTAGLKALAKELKIPVIVLSQLSREVERRDDKRPQLSDLRDSGTIEQDADVVAFVYREEYYIERAGIPAQRANESDETYATRYAQWEAHRDAVQGIAEVIVAKNRNGPIGSAKLRWDGARTWFENLAEQR
jgi:replicative DNA helicase